MNSRREAVLKLVNAIMVAGTAHAQSGPVPAAADNSPVKLSPVAGARATITKVALTGTNLDYVKRVTTNSDKVTVKIRVSFNRDGSLAGVPRMVGPAPSAKQQALFERAVAALEKCQPYTMLPPERYKQWKTLVLDIFPMNFFR